MSEDTASRPSAGVMKGVIPYLAFNGRAGEAADFYAKAFGATPLGSMPMENDPTKFMHMQILINGGAFMMTDYSDAAPAPTTNPLPNGHLQLVLEDGQGWWDRAIAAGCSAVMPYKRQFWGDVWGLLQDPFAVKWAVLQPGADQNGA